MDPIFQDPGYLSRILANASPQQLATLMQQGPPEIQQAVQAELQGRQGGGLRPDEIAPGGWQPFQPPPASSPTLAMANSGSAPSGGGLLAGDALALRKPAAPGKKAPANRKPLSGQPARGLLSDSDRLNWQQVMAHGGQVPAQIRSLLGA